MPNAACQPQDDATQGPKKADSAVPTLPAPAGRAVDVQPDLIPDEVDEEQRSEGVLGDVTQAGRDSVAAVLRVHQDLLVEDVDETRLPGSEADVAFAMSVGGGEKEHLLASDEGAHLRVELTEHLILVEGFGSFPVAVPLLQIMLTTRAGRGRLDDQGVDHHSS
jgi:hypothetical protein